MMRVVFLVLVALVAGCASGGNEDPDGGQAIDSRITSLIDSSTTQLDGARDGSSIRDSSIPRDSSVTIDAPMVVNDSGPFCTANTECSTADCCFSLGGPGFCVPGMRLGTLCVPN